MYTEIDRTLDEINPINSDVDPDDDSDEDEDDDDEDEDVDEDESTEARVQRASPFSCAA